MIFLLRILQIIFILIVVFLEKKKAGETLLWVLLMILAPLPGIILYLFFGCTFSMKMAYRMRNRNFNQEYLAEIHQYLLPLLDSDFSGGSETEQQNIRLNAVFNNSFLTELNKTEILLDGKSKYARLLEDISSAKESINISYYGFHNDEIGRQFVELLAKKAEAGITVRILCDGIGSLLATKRFFKSLRNNGGLVQKIMPLLTHYRYHRKIVVIDGKIGYTGGMNIGSKYIGSMKSKNPWRDTQVRIVGQAVYALQYQFICDWLYANHAAVADTDILQLKQFFPPINTTHRQRCQIVSTGIQSDIHTIKLSYIKMISSAKERVFLQTPYFIPDESLLDALRVALASGIKVEMMLPKRRSNFFLEPVTSHYIAQLIPLGLKVYQYDGYVHAKTVQIDDNISCIGSVNLDIRSLEIDEEICAIFYGSSFSSEIDEIIQKDLENCEELNYEAHLKRSMFNILIERVFLLFAPLM